MGENSEIFERGGDRAPSPAKTYQLLFAALEQVSWDWNQLKYYRPWALASLGWGIRGYDDVRGSFGGRQPLALSRKAVPQAIGWTRIGQGAPGGAAGHGRH